ncbi:uncharacterized protein BP5553_09658 [Venustampulla echinocandica]|uniref:Putative transcription factor kapC n=1 Tax=Venustampulla echinocandica TaxID=2656787 RepID=A0A370TBM9_9HELO|nr:uncharacterized protein BP5553_09658 [Venustampulla echinocandica]RDL31449.1 hypothetical protein BP5553_09658 [Venustampulla echinocandica]
MQSLAPAPMPQSMQTQDMSADNDLRAQLAAVISTSQQQQQPQQPQQPQRPHQQRPGPPHGYSDVPASSSASPQNHNIDPAIGGGGPPGGMMSSGAAGDSGGDDSMGDGRKGGKRELSQSKRAAQNRAAQRAFRQRKEGYIKKLEEQVREMHALEENYKAIQGENYSLREYIIHLQSRLLESQGEYPQPPPNVNLSHPHHPPRQHPEQHVQHHAGGGGAPVAAMAPMNPLNPSAARNLAAAGLSNTAKHPQEEYERKAHTKDVAGEEPADEEIIRSQLQSPHGLPAPVPM